MDFEAVQAWSRSASIISAHLADKIISIVTVTAPDRYSAAAVARAVVSDALKRGAWRRYPVKAPVASGSLPWLHQPELRASLGFGITQQ